MIRNDAINVAHNLWATSHGHKLWPIIHLLGLWLKVTATLAEISFKGYFGVERNEVKC